jgi:hypothetical protein
MARLLSSRNSAAGPFGRSQHKQKVGIAIPRGVVALIKSFGAKHPAGSRLRE